jgi:hypothetical protein
MQTVAAQPVPTNSVGIADCQSCFAGLCPPLNPHLIVHVQVVLGSSTPPTLTPLPAAAAAAAGAPASLGVVRAAGAQAHNQTHQRQRTQGRLPILRRYHVHKPSLCSH